MNTSDIELEDCPFCGGVPEIFTNRETDYKFIFCQNCDVTMKQSYWFLTEEDAEKELIKRWNTRVVFNDKFIGGEK